MPRNYGELLFALRSYGHANTVLSISGMLESKNVTSLNSRYGNSLFPVRIPALHGPLQYQDVTWHAGAQAAFASSGNYHLSATERDYSRKQSLVALYRTRAGLRRLCMTKKHYSVEVVFYIPTVHGPMVK